MANISKIPWEIGSILICSKCGAKFNEPQLAEEIKTEMRKIQKTEETQGKIRVIVSGCLGVCYPEKQTFSFMPIDGKTEVFTCELKKDIIFSEIKDLLYKKLVSK